MDQILRDVDVVVAGDGPAGLATACLIADAGHRVILLASPAPRQADPRTVALMQPAIALLRAVGVWPAGLAAASAPLTSLRIIDDRGALLAAPTVTFRANEVGADCFGWNIPVERLRGALHSRAAALGVDRLETEVRDLETAADRLTLVTAAGPIVARIAIAADGQNSRLRSLAGIAVNAWRYPQEALASSFAHSLPHDGISTEYHKPAGPFTTVPLPEGRSSLVWMDRPERIAAAIALPDEAFCGLLQAELHGDLGRVTAPGPRRAFPMRGHLARQFALRRVLLVGEAAHLLPPIGAQGLNISLRDAAHAAELITEALEEARDPGGASLLADYERRRRRDVMPRQAVVDLMNRSLLAGLLPIDALRSTGLGLVAAIPALRRMAMETGLGVGDDLPQVMRADYPF